MNVVPVRDNLPKDVTFFIGPVGSPPEFKDIYQKAVEQYDVGNTVALDEILEFQIKSLREIVEDFDAKPSPLRKLIGSLINREIGILPAFVSKGYMRRTWTPIVTPGRQPIYDDLRHVYRGGDRRSTRLNSSHVVTSYAVFCLKKKKHIT